jgi:hypothetical protein
MLHRMRLDSLTAKSAEPTSDSRTLTNTGSPNPGALSGCSYLVDFLRLAQPPYLNLEWSLIFFAVSRTFSFANRQRQLLDSITEGFIKMSYCKIQYQWIKDSEIGPGMYLKYYHLFTLLHTNARRSFVK